MPLLKIITIFLLYGSKAVAQQEPAVPAAKLWLQTRLGQYFADSLDMYQLTTSHYAQFKTEAMNLDFDGGTSPEIFEMGRYL